MRPNKGFQLPLNGQPQPIHGTICRRALLPQR